ncbi:unannotated protein [freshwater metagenome]|uniref:Unannotated protein n=1 Tax=freshwater metagenome TaxID=449393 RepID=A0A6J6ZVH3_9ZZZZ
MPTSFSAPFWSKMTRLSVWLLTAKAMRAGMLALMTPVITFALGRWVATMRWIPTALAFWAIRVMLSSTSRAATIIKSFNSSTTTTMYGRRSYANS